MAMKDAHVTVHHKHDNSQEKKDERKKESQAMRDWEARLQKRIDDDEARKGKNAQQ